MGMPELGREVGALLRPLWEPLRDFVYPLRCASCGEATQSLPWCESCGQRFLRYTEPLCSVCFLPLQTSRCSSCEQHTIPLHVGYEYRPPLRELILSMKFQSVTSVLEPLIDQFHESILGRIQGVASAQLVPIPLAEGRQFMRGYNQAELISRILSRRLGMPVSVDLLYRYRTRRPQSKVSREERAANVVGLFGVDADNLEQHRGKSLLLVDDVITTGATCREATRVLEAAGFSVVGWIALAHG